MPQIDKETLKGEFGFEMSVMKKWPSENAELGKLLAGPDVNPDAVSRMIERGKLMFKLYEICWR